MKAISSAALFAAFNTLLVAPAMAQDSEGSFLISQTGEEEVGGTVRMHYQGRITLQLPDGGSATRDIECYFHDTNSSSGVTGMCATRSDNDLLSIRMSCMTDNFRNGRNLTGPCGVRIEGSVAGVGYVYGRGNTGSRGWSRFLITWESPN